jgi:hypothetical protein
MTETTRYSRQIVTALFGQAGPAMSTRRELAARRGRIVASADQAWKSQEAARQFLNTRTSC